MKEPIRHHYIPQFILKNFSEKNDKWVYYYDKKTEEVSLKKTNEIFVINNLYRDEINNPDNPIQLELDLAKFEQEVSSIIKRFTTGNEIEITPEEEEKIKLFFAIMGLRSYNTSRTFGKNAKENEKELYSMWQNDGDLGSFWKRNLSEAAKCRSINEVLKSKTIDDPMKIFLRRDAFGLGGYNLIVGERRGENDFIIGDCYPGTITGGFENGNPTGVCLYMFFPLSPSRVLIIVSNGIEGARPEIRIFKDDVIRYPKRLRNGNHLLSVKKLYKNDVEFINDVTRENSKIGFAFLDKKRVVLE